MPCLLGQRIHHVSKCIVANMLPSVLAWELALTRSLDLQVALVFPLVCLFIGAVTKFLMTKKIPYTATLLVRRRLRPPDMPLNDVYPIMATPPM